jgi:hypothetical protein
LSDQEEVIRERLACQATRHRASTLRSPGACRRLLCDQGRTHGKPSPTSLRHYERPTRPQQRLHWLPWLWVTSSGRDDRQKVLPGGPAAASNARAAPTR